MQVLLINNDGGGFADHVEIPAETTVQAFFEQHVSGREPSDYLIRVNRLPVAADQVLQEGDRISITPIKIEGGR
jgi:sulfur carrier protein ThiS